jgi:hypothetical protein
MIAPSTERPHCRRANPAGRRRASVAAAAQAPGRRAARTQPVNAATLQAGHAQEVFGVAGICGPRRARVTASPSGQVLPAAALSIHGGTCMAVQTGRERVRGVTLFSLRLGALARVRSD